MNIQKYILVVSSVIFASLEVNAQDMLIVDGGAGFTTNLVAIPLVQNGANWETSIDFNGVKYFTFGIVASGDFMRHGKTFQGGTEQPMKF